MDLYEIINELQEERRRLSEVIRSLEVLERSLENEAAAAVPKKRGRRRMSQEERRRVSQRMREYWAARRKK